MKPLTELNLTREEVFIVLCCRQVVSVDSSSAIDDLLAHDLDWSFIEGMVRQHGIAGLVHVALLQCRNADRVPEETRSNFKAASRHNALKNLLYSREFNDIARRCNREDVRLLPLKGIAFLKTMYAHTSALRSLADIDILVEKKDIARFENILISMGYQRKQTSSRDRERQFHSIFWRTIASLPVFVEVHWDVDYADSPYAIDINGFWERSRAVASGEDTYYELSIEDSILFNCFHILREIKKGPDVLLPLKNFCDIARMTGQCATDIDWECVLQRSREYNVLRPVALVLVLVQELLEVRGMPPAIGDAMRNDGFQDDFGVCAVREYIFNPRKSDKKLLPFWMVELATPSTLREKIRALLELPAIMSQLYRARYYRNLNPSILRAIAGITGYYVQKIATTLTLWVFAPRKARMIRHKMVVTNLKTKEVISWLRKQP